MLETMPYFMFVSLLRSDRLPTRQLRIADPSMKVLAVGSLPVERDS